MTRLYESPLTQVSLSQRSRNMKPQLKGSHALEKK